LNQKQFLDHRNFRTTRFQRLEGSSQMSRPVISIILTILLCLYAISFCDTVSAARRFTDNGDGTITDNKLGLMWAKFDNRKNIGWKQAEAWVKNKFAKTINSKYKDWRLPTVEELSSLYTTNARYKGYTTDCGMLVKIVPQIKISCILIWSSDTALGAHLAYNFSIGDSFTIPSYDIDGCRALPVRSLK